MVDIAGEAVSAAVQEIAAGGGSATALTCDLSRPDGWKDVRAWGGGVPVSLFVHSACPPRQEADTVASVSEEAFDAMLAVNLRSGFFLARDIGQTMADHGIAGCMLFITSLHEATPRNLPHYSSAKAGVTMIVKELARHYGPRGIRVNALAPGAIPGGGFKPDAGFDRLIGRIPLRRPGRADEIAATAAALLSNDLTPYVTGATLRVDGGLDLFNWIEASEA